MLSDFSVGGLAFGTSEGVVGEPVFAVSGDAIVRVVEGLVYVIERGTVDAVTAFDPARPTEPLWQMALPAGANAHDLVGFDGRLWIPCQGTAEILVLDPQDGTLLDQVDVRALAGSGDGNPDLDAAVVVDGRLFVAAQQLYDDPDVPGVLYESDGGLLVELDAFGAVLDTHEVGPNPRISRGDAGRIAVLSGVFLFPGAGDERGMDGDLRLFDIDSSALGQALAAEDGADFFSAEIIGGYAVVLTVDEASESVVRCVDLEGSGPPRTFDAFSGWSITVTGVGLDAMIGVRRAPDGDVGTGVVVRLDPSTCAPIGESSGCTTLDPYDFTAL